MKIISKFKDFYDYPITGYDTDESIVYNRRTQYLKYDTFPFNKGEEDYDERPIPSIGLKDYYHHLLRLKRANVIVMNNKRMDKMGIVKFHIIGIYPEINIIPIVCILEDVSPGYWTESGPVIGNGNIIEIFTEPNLISIEKLKMISELYSLDLSTSKGNIFDDENWGVRFIEKPSSPKSIKIKKDNLKKEYPEFFRCLGSPVFYMSDYSKIIEDKKEKVPRYPKGIDIVTDCNFSELFNIDIEWLKTDTTIRNRIEHFIIEVSEKPIPESDNKTKILSHGFDLKTSFRNV